MAIVNVHKSVKNLQHNQDFIDLMAYIHKACQWDSIYSDTIRQQWTQDEFNGKRSVWGMIRTSFNFDQDTLQAIEHFGYEVNKEEDDK